MNAGIIGGIIGCVAGVAGGIIGTYFSIRNTGSIRERQFMVRMSVVIWLLGIFFISLLLLLPNPYRWFLYLPFGLLMGMGIPYINKKQQQIRAQESGEDRADGR